MKLFFKAYKSITLAAFIFLLMFAGSPQKSFAALLYQAVLIKPKPETGLKVKFIGEIIGYSYVKITLQSTDNNKRYKNVVRPLKGSC